MAGSFDTNNPPKVPGLYINFVQTAKSRIANGVRGVVALTLKAHAGTAVAGKVYEVDSDETAIELFGSANIKPIQRVLQAGAEKVLVYAMETVDEANGPTTAQVYANARLAFDARPFNVFVFGNVELDQHDEAVAWVQENRTNGKEFFVVLGGDATTDADPAQGNARSTMFADDNVINLIVGAEIGEEVLNSSEYGQYIAGLVANVALNRSLTFTQVPVSDVTLRLTKAQVATALEAGSLVLVNDGEKVKIVQGLTTSGKKIKSVKARQTIVTDITKTGEDSYIGKINNNADGQAALTSAIKAYLEELEKSGVITEIEVGVESTSGDTLGLFAGYKDVESVEKVLLSIKL